MLFLLNAKNKIDFFFQLPEKKLQHLQHMSSIQLDIESKQKWYNDYHFHFSMEQKSGWNYNRDTFEYWTKDKLDQNTRDFYENELFVKDYDGYYKNESAAHSDARKFFDEYVKYGQTPLVTIVGMCRVIMRRNDFLVDSDDDSNDDVPI